MKLANMFFILIKLPPAGTSYLFVAEFGLNISSSHFEAASPSCRALLPAAQSTCLF